ncbi:hypothetical protein OAL27_01675 [Verrucomicrobiales bacterium]|jgi:hypothetical protein|nr:hypothetical protein [Verrucomicrobiales bacterium]
MPMLAGLGMNSSRIATAQLLVANRFIEPLSEWALIDWAEHTALPELLGTNITKRTKDRLKQLLKLIPIKFIGKSHHGMIEVEKRGQLHFEEVHLWIVSLMMTAFHPLNLQGLLSLTALPCKNLCPVNKYRTAPSASGALFRIE